MQTLLKFFTPETLFLMGIGLSAVILATVVIVNRKTKRVYDN